MIVGIIVGTYSSIFIAAPLVDRLGGVEAEARGARSPAPGAGRPVKPGKAAAKAALGRLGPRSRASGPRTPSHFATTTAATQLPARLIDVRAMSMSSSTARIIATPASPGRLNARAAGRDDDERGARHRGDALRREHEDEAHRELLGEREVAPGRLRDRHRREDDVERRAVEVEAVARGQDEARDALRDAELDDPLERAGERGLRGRRRERDQERLADLPEEAPDRRRRASLSAGTRTTSAKTTSAA